MAHKEREHEHPERKDRGLRLEICALQFIGHQLKRFNDFNEFLHSVKSFEISEENEMGTSALVLVIGTTRLFDVVDVPAGSVIPPGVIPSWVSDDQANTSLSPSADGLKVAVAAANDPALVGRSFNLTVSADIPDTSTTPPGTKTITSGPKAVLYAAPAGPPAPGSFDIAEEPAA
jgi:hypothetical protein